MKIHCFGFSLLLIVIITVGCTDRYSTRAAVGSGAGGALGAYVGSELAGQTGAVIGSGLGAAAGSVLATETY
jgi:outer membrane lipoprotein SlyB